jgi:hypothetical protein
MRLHRIGSAKPQVTECREGEGASFIGLPSQGNGETPKGGGRGFWLPYSLNAVKRGAKNGFSRKLGDWKATSEGPAGRAYDRTRVFWVGFWWRFAVNGSFFDL